MTLLERPVKRTSPRAARAAAGLATALGLLLTSACGMNVQTLQPYTPAEGVNFDVGQAPVRVRNLMILSRTDGTGFLSATMSTPDKDSLTTISGTAFTSTGVQGAAVTATLAEPVSFADDVPIILTERQPLITVTSADLKPGLEAQLTLVFSTAGSVTTRVPVVDADQPAYATITPSPEPTSSPTP